MAEKNKSESFKTRESQRKRIRGLMIDAYNNGEVDKFKAFQELLEGELNYEFEELQNNGSYVKALKNNYFAKTGEQFDGNINTLIEDDFEHWNMIDASLVAGGVAAVNAFTELDEDVKKNNLIRYKNYISTPSFGDYSRPFTEQAKGVAAGVGIDVATSGGVGALGSKLLGKKAARNLLLSGLSSKAKVTGTGALYGMVGDVERQTMEIGMGDRENYDIGQTAISAGMGAVAPQAGALAGKTIGPVGRAVASPFQAAGTFVKTLTGGYGATSAARGMTRQAGETVEKYGADNAIGSTNFMNNLNSSIQNTHKYYQDAFDDIELTGVNPIGVQNVIKRWGKEPGMEISPKAKSVIEKLDKKTITPLEALRELKQILWTESRDVTATPSDRTSLTNFRKDLIAIEENAAINQGKRKEYVELKSSYGKYRELLKTDMGKKIIKASENPEAAGRLIKSMAIGEFSWNNYRQFQIGMNKALKGTGNESAAITLNRNIQEAMGGFLRGESGDYANLVKLINNKNGLQTLKRMYPEDKAFWQSMEELGSKLPKQKGGTICVVMNMAIARLGSNIGSDLTAGAASKQLRSFGGIIGSVGGISVVNKLVDQPFFQKAMIRAYNRQGGTLDTATKAWLKNKGYSRTEINSIQDTLWGLSGTGFALGSLDEIWDTYEDPIRREIEEIKAGFTY